MTPRPGARELLRDPLRGPCCYERRVTVIDAFFDPADTIVTVRSPIRRA
ncbi:hypothetical protein AB0O68_19635 [Streptomyces sp. NPDC087512]